MPKIDKYFNLVKEWKGSDLHMVAGNVPKVRVQGQLRNADATILSDAQCQEYLLEICPPAVQEKLTLHGHVDFSYAYKNVARFRCNYFLQYHGLGAVFRMIPEKILSLGELHLDPGLVRFAKLQDGLVLLTGPTGCGKSTTLAALLDYINTTYAKRIITIEDPVEYIHQNKKSLMIHREVGTHTPSFYQGLQAALYEDPDVIMLGEMRDIETMRLAISAAEMGILVFATTHTNNAVKAVDRIIQFFPDYEQDKVRTQLAESLKGVIAQILVKTLDGTSRLPINEVLVGGVSVSNTIREGKIGSLMSIIQGSKAQGMRLMDDALREELKARRISPLDAYRYAVDKRSFKKYLKQ